MKLVVLLIVSCAEVFGFIRPHRVKAMAKTPLNGPIFASPMV